MNKICKKCGIEKDITEFRKRKNMKSGYGNSCKKCDNKYHRILKGRNEIYEESIKIKEREKETGNIICKKCGLEKNMNQYYYLYKICKICCSEEGRLKHIEKMVKCYGSEKYEEHKIEKEKYKKLKEMGKKQCKLCNTEKNIDEFEERGRRCKLCLSDLHKLYYINNKDLFKINNNKYKKRRNELRNIKRNTDPLYKLTDNIRGLIRCGFKKSGYKKGSKTELILGCSFEEFKIYLETKFESWMTWENYGKYNGNFEYGWDIDHIEPLFPKGHNRTEEDIIRLNHYTNLQPLCSNRNRNIKKNVILQK